MPLTFPQINLFAELRYVRDLYSSILLSSFQDILLMRVTFQRHHKAVLTFWALLLQVDFQHHTLSPDAFWICTKAKSANRKLFFLGATKLQRHHIANLTAIVCLHYNTKWYNKNIRSICVTLQIDGRGSKMLSNCFFKLAPSTELWRSGSFLVGRRKIVRSVWVCIKFNLFHSS